MSIVILIVEDTARHYRDLLPFVHQAARQLGLTEGTTGDNAYRIEDPVKTREAAEAAIERYEQQRAKLLVIFDIHIEGEHLADLDDLIGRLWKAPADSWRGQVSIIVYSVFVETLDDLPDRPHSARIRKLPRGSENIWEQLRVALRAGLQALL